MAELEKILLRIVQEEGFRSILTSQHKKEPPDLQAVCEWCTEWCKQDSGFRKLTQSSLCHPNIKVCCHRRSTCTVPITDHTAHDRACNQMRFLQRSTSLLEVHYSIRQSTRKQHLCIQVRSTLQSFHCKLIGCACKATCSLGRLAVKL